MVIKKQRRDAAAAGGGFKLKSKVAESLSLSGAILNDTFPSCGTLYCRQSEIKTLFRAA